MAAPPQPGTQFERERRELEIVLTSRTISRGPNLSKILSYVCEKLFSGDLDSIREYNIAVEALGRKSSFDPSADSIVRVEVSRLRRRLRDYYAVEGAARPLRIQLPESGYVPQFVEASLPQAPAPPELPPAPASPAPPTSASSPSYRFRLTLGLLAIMTALCCWLLWQNLQLRSSSTPARPPTPFTNHLWTQLLGGRRHTLIVTSDANAMTLGNILNRPVTLNEYRSSSYPRGLLEAHIPNPELLLFMSRFMGTFLTSTHDSIAAAELRRVAANYGAVASVVFSRDFRTIPRNAGNIILLGHRKANPTVELFEDRTNFVYSWDPQKRKGILLNRKPAAGEKPAYPVEVNRSYGTIAYIDAGKDVGTVLIIGGNDMSGVEIGARFLSSEDSLRKLYASLHLNSTQPVPSFEILLVAQRVFNVPDEPEIAAWRRSSH